MHRIPSRGLTTLLAVVTALTACALVAPPRAHAHAVLLQTGPAQQALLTEGPDAVTLAYSENVSLKLGGVDVFSPAGPLVNEGAVTVTGDTVTAPVHAPGTGTYAVSWRVISADGHPIRGAFVFSVGQRSAAGAAQKQAFAAAETDRALSIAFGFARFAYLAAILLAAGGALFAAFVAPRSRPRLLAPALFLVIVASAIGFVLQTSIAANVGVGEAFDLDLMNTQLSTLYGNATLTRVVLAALALLVLLARPYGSDDRVPRLAVAGVLAALAFTLSLSGHAMATTFTGIRLPLDMLHVLFAAAWAGGLVQLHHYIRDDPAPEAVVRFSKLALASVIVIVLTGTYATLIESDVSLSALVETNYGLVLGGKIVLLLLTIPIANLNRTRTVPGLVAGDESARHAMRRYVRIEIALVMAVIALTAMLIETVPARHAAHKIKPPAGPASETVKLPSGARALLTIDPATVGPNAFALAVRTPAGEPDAEIDEIRLTGTLAKRDIDRLPIEIKRAGAGRWTSAATLLPLAGKWRFEVTVRRGEFDEENAKIDAEIAPSGG